MAETFAVSTSSLDLVVINNLLTTAPLAAVDFTPASYVSGTFSGIGLGLTNLTASYIPSTTIAPTSSFAISASFLSGPHTGSTFGTASFATSASYALNGGSGGGLATGSTYPITASQAITASYWDSSSIVNFFGTKQNNISTGSTLPVTASQAISASYALNAVAGGLATGSTYPITSSQAVSASYSITASYAMNGGTGGGLATGSTYPITSSQAVSASYVLSASYAPGSPSISASYADSASYALSARSASYAPGSPSLNAESASYLTPSQANAVILTSSLFWITCSFNESSQQVNLTNTASYFFTHSVLPASGKVSDLLLVVSHSATTGTSSLTFPTSWKNIGGNWPIEINGISTAVIWLRAVDNTSIIGTYNASGGSLTVPSASYALTSSNGVWAKTNWVYYQGSITVGQSRNLTATRIGVGNYGFSFTTPLPDVDYDVMFSGISQSRTVPTLVTASCGGAYNKTINNFSMSFQNAGTGVVRNDVASGSVVVFDL